MMAEFIDEIEAGSRSLFGFVEKDDVTGIRHLVSDGADVNVRDKEGQTPLHMASARGKVGVVEVLLSLKADVDAKDLRVVTPLHLACREGHAAIVEMLVNHGADIHAHDRAMKTAVYKSCAAGSEEIVDFLLKNGALVCSTKNAIIPAVKHGSPEMVEKLIQHDPSVAIPGDALLRACERNSFLIVKALVRKGADINYRGEGGVSALHVASAQKGSEDVVRLLLDEGAYVRVLCSDLTTPLLWACRASNIGVIDLLVDRGADVNVRDKENSPLHSAVAKQNLDMVNLLLSQKADPNVGDYNGATPLHWACECSSVEIVETLLKHGAKVNALDGETRQMPLLTAVQEGHSRMVKLLLAFEARVDGGPDEYKTPLCYACTREKYDMIKVLIELGPPLTYPERKRKLMVWAQEENKLEVMELLKKAKT